MKKLILIMSLWSLIIFFYCNSSSGQNSKTDQDKEFDNGSNIVIVDSSEKVIQDLSLLGKVWGFLKYYHPQIAAGNYNWDYELFRIIPKIISCRNKYERNSILKKWIENLGEIQKTNHIDLNKASGIKMMPDLEWINERSKLGDELPKILVRIKDAERTDDHYYLSFAPIVGNPIFKNEKVYETKPFPDAGYRILSLFRYWNIIQYLSPYRYLVKGNWNDVLPEFLKKIVNAGNEQEYVLSVLELIARVRDSHASTWAADQFIYKYRGANFSNEILKFVEDKVIVTGHSYEDLAKTSVLKKGDIILSIDNENISEIIKRKGVYISASNNIKMLDIIAHELLRSGKDSLKVKYDRNGKIFEKYIGLYPPKRFDINKKSESKVKCWKFLQNDIGYIYPGTIKNDSIPKIMSAFKDTKGIVLDMRCYPGEFIVFSLGSYLMPQPTEFVKFTNTDFEAPGTFKYTPALSVGYENPNHYKGKIIILTDETTMSQAEYATMCFRKAPNARVIGSTTAGADGNISQLGLPGGLNTIITAIGVYYPDGKETQGMGIIPDIKISPTIKGIRENRDELLEKAVEIIKSEVTNKSVNLK